MPKKRNLSTGRQVKKNIDLDPDQIFLDSSNLPSFDVDMFEGRIEKPIAKAAILVFGVFIMLMLIVFVGRSYFLQVISGEYFFTRSASNSLKRIPVPSPRGMIYDRNGVELAWSERSGRAYMPESGLAHLIGYVGFPSQDQISISTTTDPTDVVGKDGVEKKYNDWLRGKDGSKIIEVNAHGEIQSEYLYEPGSAGGNITLSVDSRITKKFYEYIKNLAGEYNFKGGAGVIMDLRTGEIIAMTSYPEYEPAVLSKGDDRDAISKYINDKNMPFLNRVVSGTYTPGSIVKPIFAMAALKEGVITPEKKIQSKGYIAIPNPFFPDQQSIFKDWRVQGWVDMRRALSVSSDVYFYEIGGGFEGQKGLGIDKLEEYSKMFGLGTTTGIALDKEGEGNIPSPAWKSKNFKGDQWRIGDTYHSSIGQYGFLVTPLQMVRAVGAIATDGKLITPRVFHGEGNIGVQYSSIDIPKEIFNVVKEGMRKGVTDADGTARALNVPEVEVAAKTGTAELGVSKALVNSWGVGFFPYDNPKYSFALVMEKGPRENTVGANLAIRKLIEWMAVNTPEYFK
ncbi:MAG: hypothetical protein HY225_03460 [Candidatus Vogelbacteria bacterium]|nr:hypothetical protein [Candidatus Vogelbacteria bacterium]